jgi:hypothetical protein
MLKGIIVREEEDLLCWELGQVTTCPYGLRILWGNLRGGGRFALLGARTGHDLSARVEDFEGKFEAGGDLCG